MQNDYLIWFKYSWLWSALAFNIATKDVSCPPARFITFLPFWNIGDCFKNNNNPKILQL